MTNNQWNEYSISLEDEQGRSITISTGKLARQSDGAVTVKMGDAVVLATVCSALKIKEGQDFFPLSVDYQEKFAGAGRIPGGFLKRESRLSDYEVLISRLIDRTLRPMFPDGYYNETQIMISLISSDTNILGDTLAGLAAAAAIAVSDIPFEVPVSEVRVARIDGKFVVNPYKSDLERADLEIIIGASERDILMVEGEAAQCSEADLVQAIKIGHDVIKQHCRIQREMQAAVGKTKRIIEPTTPNTELQQKIADFCQAKVYEVAKGALPKHQRKEQLSLIKTEFLATLTEEENEDQKLLSLIDEYYHDLERTVIREMILAENMRLDGRGLTDVRPLLIETNYLPSPHGSALFCRGETQSITTCTLGTKLDEQMLDKASGLEYSKFILHYNFPAFSTGEIKPSRGPGRREIGHGNLAMRSLKQVLPSQEENPYTLRIVSDILESNGSSSMATVCAGSLALMDAGVQIKSNVSGIAMGLITDGAGRFAVLTDILGDEDHLGDMDFKVTGTINGICGIQMDLKIDGLPYPILEQALQQAKAGRLHILNAMNEVMETPRPEPKPHAPRIVKIYIPREFIGAVIGPGGKVIQEMQRQTGAIINIEEVGDQGEINIAANNKEAIDAALARIKGIVTLPEEGEIYEGKVTSIQTFGAFVEILPGKEGLLHISEVDWKRLENLDGVLKEGDIVQVKLLEVDKKTGKLRLSRKALITGPNGETYVEKPREQRDNRSGGGGNRDRNDRRGGGDDRKSFKR